MPDEKQITTLVTELETTHGDAISVQTAVNVMLAVDNLVDDIHKAYARDQDFIRRLRPFERGSFEIVLELVAMAAPLLGESPLLAMVFKGLKEFFAIKSQLAGRKYTITGNNVIVVSGGEHIEVSPTGIVLLNPKSSGAKAAEKAFDTLEHDPSLREIRFRRGESEPFSRVPRQEFAYYGLPETMEETQDKPVRAIVGIRQPAFASDLKWRLVWNGEKVTAAMEDEYFLERAISGGEIFCQKDRLDVTLVLKQERDPQSGQWINMNTGHVIKKVWEHIRPDEQMNLEKDFANG